MAQPTTGILFNSTTPAAPAGFANVKPQTDGGVPLQQVSFYAPAVGGVNVQTGDYTAVAADSGKLISFNGAGGPFTLTLPPTPPSATWWISVENIGTATVTIDPNALQLDGGEPDLILTQDTGVSIATDGTNYFTQRGCAGSGGSGGGGSLALEVNSTPNGSQTLLNLEAGIGISIVDDGLGGITIAAGTGAETTDFVQGASNAATSSGTVVTCAFAAPNTAGNCIIVDFVGLEAFGGAGSWAVSDSQGNTYAAAAINQEQNNVRATLWYALNCKGGANTITVTYSGGSSNAMAVAIHEYSGVADVAALDTSTFGQAPDTSTLPISLALTTSGAGGLLHLFCGCNAGAGGIGGPFTDSDGWAQRENIFPTGLTDENPSITSFDSAGNAGSYSDDITISNTGTPVYISGYLVALFATAGTGPSVLQPYQEVPTGAIDGSNQTYMLGRVPAANTLIYVRNGVAQNPFGSSPDFVISGNTITTATPLKAGTQPDWHFATYWA